MILIEQNLNNLTIETPAVSPEGRRPEGETAGGAANLQVSSTPDVQVTPKLKAARRTFSTAYKLSFLEAYEACDNASAL